MPALLDAVVAIDRLSDGPWLAAKRREVLEAIRSCSGLWLEALASEATATPGLAVTISATALNRSGAPLSLVRLEVSSGGAATGLPAQLPENRPVSRQLSVTVPRDARLSQPYWLEGYHGGGVYAVPEQTLVGAPHSPPALTVTFVVRAGTQQLDYVVPVTYRWLDPVVGERNRELAIVPRATVNLEAPVILFPDRKPRTVRAAVQAHAPATAVTVRLRPPSGWEVEPAQAAVTLAKTNDESTVTFTLTPPAAEGSGVLKVSVETDRDEPARSFITVDHPHIAPQTLLPAAEAKLVRVDVSRPVRHVGYVMGAGDEIPAVLRQLGFEVTLLSDDDLANTDLKAYDAIVAGVRAYDTRQVLAQAQDRLLAYVQGGGTLIVQYNTERGLVTDRLGPYPLTIGRDRTTDETAAVKFLVQGHPLLTSPMAINVADFGGWVQERGLNYPSKWDPRYQPLLAMADPGEQPDDGALLFARAGKGTYIYTGLAFFRQLPAGVPGAIRLFVNLLAGGRG